VESRAKRRSDRIRAEVSILALLGKYGFADIDPFNDVEQQFRCHLHGNDQKPSARVYPSTNSFHCWACGKSRDPINLTMDAEGIEFSDALAKLEAEYDLPPMPFDPVEEKGPGLAEQVEAAGHSTRTYEQEHKRVVRMLDNLTTDRDLTMDATLAFWEMLDRIVYGVEQEGWGEQQGKEQIIKLRARIMERIGSV